MLFPCAVSTSRFGWREGVGLEEVPQSHHWFFSPACLLQFLRDGSISPFLRWDSGWVVPGYENAFAVKACCLYNFSCYFYVTFTCDVSEDLVEQGEEQSRWEKAASLESAAQMAGEGVPSAQTVPRLQDPWPHGNAGTQLSSGLWRELWEDGEGSLYRNSRNSC